jgi:hypothetical protein
MSAFVPGNQYGWPSWGNRQIFGCDHVNDATSSDFLMCSATFTRFAATNKTTSTWQQPCALKLQGEAAVSLPFYFV